MSKIYNRVDNVKIRQQNIQKKYINSYWILAPEGATTNLDSMKR